MEKSVLNVRIHGVRAPGEMFTQVLGYPATKQITPQALWIINRWLYEPWMGEVFPISDNRKDENHRELARSWAEMWNGDGKTTTDLGGFTTTPGISWTWGVLRFTTNTQMSTFRQWLSANGEDVYGEFCP